MEVSGAWRRAICAPHGGGRSDVPRCAARVRVPGRLRAQRNSY
ncbi:hypothetical protein C7S15_0320 [Burkholderia cepacia]|nr:hypothetical protein [Burkholderia cepacia]